MTSPNPGGAPKNLPGIINPGVKSTSQSLNLPALKDALLSPNPVANITAAEAAAQVLETPTTDIQVTFYDKFYQSPFACLNYKDLQVNWERNAIGTAKITLMQNDPLVPVVMNCWQSVIPVIIQSGNLRWTGRVEYCDYAFRADPNGGPAAYDVTVFCTSDWQWFERIYAWPNPFAPLQAQFPTYCHYFGPAVTVVKTILIENIFRLQSGLWEFVNNGLSGDLDWNAWFGTINMNQDNLKDMLITPMVVIPEDVLADDSYWVAVTGRMDKVSVLLEKVLKDNGLLLTAEVWMPGDPQPKGLAVELKAPTIVVDCKNFSGVSGPTGSFIDGFDRGCRSVAGECAIQHAGAIPESQQ